MQLMHDVSTLHLDLMIDFNLFTLIANFYVNKWELYLTASVRLCTGLVCWSIMRNVPPDIPAGHILSSIFKLWKCIFKHETLNWRKLELRRTLDVMLWRSCMEYTSKSVPDKVCQSELAGKISTQHVIQIRLGGFRRGVTVNCTCWECTRSEPLRQYYSCLHFAMASTYDPVHVVICICNIVLWELRLVVSVCVTSSQDIILERCERHFWTAEVFLYFLLIWTPSVTAWLDLCWDLWMEASELWRISQ